MNNNKPIKKVAAIHDMSGFGRASLTTIIPILSTMGIQVCPLPTAILSTQTSGFEGYSFLDLTDYMKEHIEHWKKINLEFDCIYSGFLGSPEQIKIVEDFIDYFGEKAELIVIDPVMGDDGELYGTMDDKMVRGMKNLIKKADIITPNFTELSYLLDKKYDTTVTLEEIKNDLRKLANEGPKIIIATSVPDLENQDKIITIAYNRMDDVFWKISSERIPVSYPGTGDAYTSVVIGNLLKNNSLPISIERAAMFISHCLMNSYGFNYPHREGVLLEKSLNILNLPLVGNSYIKL